MTIATTDTLNDKAEIMEDVVRKPVSLDGDTDTLAAIAGAMAEEIYSIPESVKKRRS